jgi:hypothetical protein
MKSKGLLLAVNGLLIALSLVQFSCGSSKKSAVPCPDFSHSRNMKRGHAQLKGTYPEQQEKYHANSTWAYHPRFVGQSKDLGNKNAPASLFSVPLSLIAGIRANVSGACPNRILASVQQASLVVPQEGIQKPASVSEEKVQQGCDTLVLRNGDFIWGRVLEIGQREIRYKKCEDTQGPVLTIPLADVFMIKYPNGTRDYFTSERSPASSGANALPKKNGRMARTGFIFSLVGFFVFTPLGILAVVFSGVSLGRINEHPERYKGRGFAIAGIIIGAVDVIGMLIILASM